jgi:hypothetical protein
MLTVTWNTLYINADWVLIDDMNIWFQQRDDCGNWVQCKRIRMYALQQRKCRLLWMMCLGLAAIDWRFIDMRSREILQWFGLVFVGFWCVLLFWRSFLSRVSSDTLIVSLGIACSLAHLLTYSLDSHECNQISWRAIVRVSKLCAGRPQRE